ncbi:transcription-repair coupling factor [Clostridia bacterium OttesenSCG-928-F22]|nr:transcription-repair coupling factor [Clostridia bacterium OttesenSCG-928-F22]
MSQKVIETLQSQEAARFIGAIREGEFPVSLFGMPQAYKGALIALMAKQTNRKPVFVAKGAKSAQDMYEELDALGLRTVYFPQREMRLLKVAAKSREAIHARASALYAMGQCDAVVTDIAAILPRLTPAGVFYGGITTLAVGQEMDMEELIARLSRAGYARVPMIETPGNFSVRGGIVDIYPVNGVPIRIEFFGDEVDSIRSVDEETQRSVDVLQQVSIAPATEAILDEQAIKNCKALFAGSDLEQHTRYTNEIEKHGYFDEVEQYISVAYEHSGTLFDYVQDGVVFFDEPRSLEEACRNLNLEFFESYEVQLKEGNAVEQQRDLLFQEEILHLPGRDCVYLASIKTDIGIRGKSIHYNVQAAAQYHGRLDALAADALRYKQQGRRVIIGAPNTKRMDALRQELAAYDITAAIEPKNLNDPGIYIVKSRLKHGFNSPSDGVCLFGENDIAVARRQVKAKTRTGKMDVFVDVSPGDYVVHDIYGIGKYLGMEKVVLDDASHDYMVISYHAGDKLKVPADQMNRVQKYIGGDDVAPKLSRLGGSDWARAKKRVKESVKALAFDLAELYAQRSARQGFAFSADSPWQRQFEENFPYEETPDQLSCIAEIKSDMESGRVMDRLLCGDVGYGKTEVALRAAFKAVQDSKQVAMLVPTTILAQQHYETLKQRMEGFPVRVAMLSRFNKPKEQKEICAKLAAGEIDIIVGTHKLLGKEVKFRDLGLLVIDEEQRFGVAHKESIKRMKNAVDVLTLSATPIPRTLHMSLSGIRDMSVIETPPEQRYPIQTYVLEYTEQVVHDAIEREMARGGQVFFVYNNVRNIEQFRIKLLGIVPNARIAIAHGQMNEAVLEKTMLQFGEGEFDVLLCSTIIESGLDIPNVNTLIVYDADHFGLSQLYQLRGRVGRSTKLAFAYLTFRQQKAISETAQKRLVAIRDFTDFGSGFKIAMRDLELRGAGNVMGAQQHGHMAEVGYELYVRMVEEAVRDIKGEVQEERIDAIIDARIDAHIPQSYIKEEVVRIDAYRRIAAITTREELSGVWEELEDRFSSPPESVQNLMVISLIKACAEHCGIGNVSIRANYAALRVSGTPDFDGGRVIALLQEYGKAATLSASEVSVFILRTKKDVEEMLQFTLEFLEKLKICKSSADSV